MKERHLSNWQASKVGKAPWHYFNSVYFSGIINAITKDSETSKTGSADARTHLDSDLLQQEVYSPDDIPIAVVKGHHTLILIFACNLHELGDKHNQCNQQNTNYLARLYILC